MTAVERAVYKRTRSAALVYTPFISKPVHVQVRFAREAGTCASLEGDVQHAAGDAIVEGARQEHWPVKAAQFAAKYEPLPGTEAGADGGYAKRVGIVQASRLTEPLGVALPNGAGTLAGKAGDWHVRYADGGQSIVGGALFDGLYEPARIPLLFRATAALAAETDATAPLEALRDALRHVLRHTAVQWLRSGEDDASPAWFVVTGHGAHRPLHFDNVLELPIDILCGSTPGIDPLARRIERLQEPPNYASFTLDKLSELARRFRTVIGDDPEEDIDPKAQADELADILARQLVSLDLFNASIGLADRGTPHFAPEPGRYQQPLASPAPDAVPGDATSADPALLTRFLQIGAVADTRASHWQKHWQRSVLGTTEQLAGSKYEEGPDAAQPGWQEPRHLEKLRDAPLQLWLCALPPPFRLKLFTLGLASAVVFTWFTELAEGCAGEGEGALPHWLPCREVRWHQVSGKCLLGTYVVLMAVAWLLYARAQARHLKRRHQDCRLLAESIRVHYVLTAAGLPAATVDAIPTGGPASSNWVVQALRVLIHRYAAQPLAPATTESLEAARILFVRDQIMYHRRTLVGRRRFALKRITGLSTVGILVAMGALAWLVVDGFLVAKDDAMPSLFDHLRVVAMLGGLATWAALKRLAEAYGWEAEAQRGVVVLNALRQAEHTFEHDTGREARARALTECGEMFVADQAAWHNLHRARPIEAASGV